VEDLMSSMGPGQLKSRPKDTDRATRRPQVLWDRVKIVLFLVGAFVVLVWADTVPRTGVEGNEIPGLTFREALRANARSYWWILALAGLEVLRQLHYYIEEQSAGYYAFWKRAGGRWEGLLSGMNEWTRWRLGRVVKFLAFLVILSFVLAAIFGTSPATALFRVPSLIIRGLPLAFQLAFGAMFLILQFVALFWFLSRGGVDTYMPDDIDTRFTDVKGQDAVLERVMENMIFLEDPESIENRGGYVPGGILLWGPPGTGKTLMAQAVAGETAKPFVFVEPGAFINMFFGVGVLKVKGLYRKLRKLAVRYGGVIVFFDEADALGNRGMAVSGQSWNIEPSPWTTEPSCNGLAYLSESGRQVAFFGPTVNDPAAGPIKDPVIMGAGMGGGGMGTLQALLTEMSGLKKPRGFFNRFVRKLLGMKPKPPPKYRILHIFATNLPQALDEAMLRPGRVDRIYKVGYPHKEGRVDTLRYYLAKVSNDLTEDQIVELATITPYFAGAKIQDLVNEALVIAIRDGRETITWKDVIKAKQLKEHGLPDDHEYIQWEQHAVAVHEACHAVVAYRLRKHAAIDLATIERRGDIGGFVSSIPLEDQFAAWQSEREIDAMTALASLAGERLFFEGDHSTGVGGDMRSATAIQTQMYAYYAMGDTLASRSINLASIRGAQPAETGTDRALFDSEFGKSVEAGLRELYQRTWDLLEENRLEVLRVAHALETHKTITGDDIAAVVVGEPGPLVDGRPYADPRFVEELYRYHDACVAAQKAHGEVSDRVPVPVPPPPVGALAASSPATTTPSSEAGGNGGGPGHKVHRSSEGPAASD
jgi:ATP-dependent Zn protease